MSAKAKKEEIKYPEKKHSNNIQDKSDVSVYTMWHTGYLSV